MSSTSQDTLANAFMQIYNRCFVRCNAFVIKSQRQNILIQSSAMGHKALVEGIKSSHDMEKLFCNILLYYYFYSQRTLLWLQIDMRIASFHQNVSRSI